MSIRLFRGLLVASFTAIEAFIFVYNYVPDVTTKLMFSASCGFIAGLNTCAVESIVYRYYTVIWRVGND